MSETPPASQFDTALKALAKRQRRVVLTELLHCESLRPRDIARRTGGPEPTLLRHNDLPRLTDMGYIEWDDETELITRGPKFDEIEPLLELIVDHGDELPPDWI